MRANKYLVGLVFGVVGGLWHVFWLFLVWVDWGQAFIDLIFRLHFIRPPYTIRPFDFGTAAMLVGIVFVIWYVFGFIAALVWNLFHKQ